MKKLLPVAMLVSLTSCASIISGTSQTINVNSTPSGAECDLVRYESSAKKESVIASVSKTPGQATIQKTKHDITVKCKKGNMKGESILDSGSEGATVGNIILGGGIGWAVDSAVGADNKYPENINVPLAAN